MTLNTKLLAIMDGNHVMGSGSAADRLSTYHDAQAVKKAMLIRRDQFERFTAIKKALKNYRLMVNFTGDNKTRIFDPATHSEVIL